MRSDRLRPRSAAAWAAVWAALLLGLLLRAQPQHYDPLQEPSPDASALPLDRGAPGVWSALQKLRTRASLIMLTAHPDDEDGGLLAYAARGLGARVFLLPPFCDFWNPSPSRDIRFARYTARLLLMIIRQPATFWRVWGRVCDNRPTFSRTSIFGWSA
jgi:hypothetical protein